MKHHSKPKWLRELLRFLPLKSQFVLSGHIKDLQLSQTDENTYNWHKLNGILDIELRAAGYAEVIYYDPVEGFQIPLFTGTPSEKQQRFNELNLPVHQSRHSYDVEAFSQVLHDIVNQSGPPVAVIVDFASQFIMNPENLVKPEHNAFTMALMLSQKAAPKPFGTPPKPFYNSVIWLVDKEGDLPDWMIVNNPKIYHIPIDKPDHIVRRNLAGALLSNPTKTRNDQEQIIDTFVDATEGLLLLDLVAIIELAQAESIRPDDIQDAVRRYKVGVTEDPWIKIDRHKIVSGENFIRSRVKGQDHSVSHILDIVKRAITGVGRAKKGSRPRGVVFLAGPTGVGKTELAKTLTSLLFGDESAYIRFDMSEFSAEHSDQRLIGAPPGYVGYDVGGELTNAVRQKPFSVVLFDEIEKAHPRILDKFLQILDDGVLTSGRGDKVYFSETLIIFTSNLGLYKNLPDGKREANVTSEDPFEVVRKRVKEEIERYFKLQLNRPELLNRIGDNIIIFDFIRTNVAEEIFQLMIDSHVQGIQQQLTITLAISPSALRTLKALATSDLDNGGRGIRNKLEYHFINPLAREFFALNPQPGDSIFIEKVESTDTHTVLSLSKK